MIFRKNKTNDSLLIRQAIADLSQKVDNALTVYKETSLSEREFKLLDEKSKIQNDMIEVKTQVIKLEDAIQVKDKIVENLKQALDEKDKELKEHKEKVKNLSLDYSKNMDYKAKYEEQKKEVTKLQKQLDKLNEKGVVVPKKVTPAVPKKGQSIRTKIRMTGVAVAKIQKEISENNLEKKEEK